jgi:photosystem II stability/assembly factor-like uncharacterized protein
VSWAPRPSGTTQTLRAIWGSAAGELFAAGDKGTVLRSTDAGETWQAPALPEGISQNLYAVYGFATEGAPTEVLVAGNGYLLRSTDGGVSFTAPGKVYGLGVWGSAPDDVYVTSRKYGRGSLVLHTSDGGLRFASRDRLGL